VTDGFGMIAWVTLFLALFFQETKPQASQQS
jgi:hypothetical protein